MPYSAPKTVFGAFFLGEIIGKNRVVLFPSSTASGRFSSDAHFMKFALALARGGRVRVSPNPLVGCVIVRNNRIVGEGYHEYFGGPHAEINALGEAGKRAVGSTLYVTLEPCNHFGKTPPCTDAIIRAGVARVVIACRDPNPKMNGRGIRRMKRNSIQVVEGVLAGEAQQLNRSYFRMQGRRQRSVVVKYAMSADGKIATRNGDSKWISSAQSRRLVHKLRAEVDAIVIGATTALRDNPHLTSHGNGSNPVRVIVDPSLKVPLNSRIFDGAAPTIVFHDLARGRKKLNALAAKQILAVRLPCHKGRMDFRQIIGRLNDFSLFNILIEGGGDTIASALEDGVVTDVKVFIAPKILGGRSAITPIAGGGVARVEDAVRLAGIRMKAIGRDYLLEAKVVRQTKKERLKGDVHRNR